MTPDEQKLELQVKCLENYAIDCRAAMSDALHIILKMRARLADVYDDNDPVLMGWVDDNVTILLGRLRQPKYVGGVPKGESDGE